MFDLIVEFAFVRRTLVVGLMLAIAIPLIGIVMVNRRTSMMGDALSHTSLAGVALGLIAGFNPVIGAIAVAVLGAFVIEGIRKRFPHYGDMATAVTLSAGLGVAVILSDLAPSGRSFDSYLFGSISAVTEADVWLTAVVFALVVATSVVCYGSLLDMVVDPILARLAGNRVGVVNAVFTALAAITVALAVKVIGALLVVSLMVLPVATALIVARSYAQSFWLSIAASVVYTMTGLVISYSVDVRPGGAIVVTAVLGMGLTALFRKIRPASRRSAVTVPALAT
ncbi:metal ABC transporter permease [Corynebacterium freneyi]|uniref:Zinc transport system permease protein n=1 Tax=Corynebacterium freneyi TaxID=134034 RepID=A0ABS4U5R2_9CORY|nr:metal ABC transporter permease [Corynebacterium freneyi]MBP2331535.1 zinc transport system permease protein [Corynebacterium freneyi]QXA51998.1 metal ABC transporter permease [Corynebacterium freneyi]WJZ06342.1 High-affinity zinc uptake system membrane protein ZnuB [Corynebacterium freneyi]